MILHFETQNIAHVQGASVGKDEYGIGLNSGYLSETIFHMNVTPFSEKILLNFIPGSVPTSGKLKVRVWREELSSLAFDSTPAGTYVEGVTFPASYGMAPVVAEIDYTEMVSGGSLIQVIREIDIGSFFNKVVPDHYRIIFENTTNATLSSNTLRYEPKLAIVQATYVKAIMS